MLFVKINALYILMRIHSIFDLQYYDIRKECEGQLCYDFSAMDTFLNEDAVRHALGVGNIDFVSCSSEVYDAMILDWMRNLEVDIPALLEDGIRVLIYAGEEDLICNWLGKPIWFNQNLKSSLCCGYNIKMLVFEQEIQGGFMQWNGLASKNLEQPQLFHLWLRVQKQDK